jgi:predicted nucleic acid-binding Zn ribbon protein
MPTYHYRCAKNHDRELSHSIHYEGDVKCLECGGVMNRVPGQIGNIKFYGTGWYTTDKTK